MLLDSFKLIFYFSFLIEPDKCSIKNKKINLKVPPKSKETKF